MGQITKRLAFVPDVHRPYHDPRAWELFLAAMEQWKPDILIVQGDFCDFYSVSSFSKDPRREQSLYDEIEDAKKGLEELDALGATRKIFLEGNHEHRLTRYLADKAPKLFEFVDIPRLYKLKERDYEFVQYKTSTQIGKLWLTHDCGYAGRYSVFRTADIYQHPVAMAHTHRLVYVVEGNATGESFPAVQFGWLGDVEQVDYMHRQSAKRAWSLAFGTGLLEMDTGYVHLTPHPIVVNPKKKNGGRYSTLIQGERIEG